MQISRSRRRSKSRGSTRDHVSCSTTQSSACRGNFACFGHSFPKHQPDADRPARTWDFLEHNLYQLVKVTHIPAVCSRLIQQLYTRHRDCTSLLDLLAAVSTFLLSCLPCASSLFAPHPSQSQQFLILGCKIAHFSRTAHPNPPSPCPKNSATPTSRRIPQRKISTSLSTTRSTTPPHSLTSIRKTDPPPPKPPAP